MPRTRTWLAPSCTCMEGFLCEHGGQKRTGFVRTETDVPCGTSYAAGRPYARRRVSMLATWHAAERPVPFRKGSLSVVAPSAWASKFPIGNDSVDRSLSYVWLQSDAGCSRHLQLHYMDRNNAAQLVGDFLFYFLFYF